MAERSRTIADRSESLADRAETGVSTISQVRSRLDGLTEQTADLKGRLDEFTCEAERGGAETNRSGESATTRRADRRRPAVAPHDS